MRKNSSWMALAFAVALVGGASAQAPVAGPQGRGGRPPGPVEVHMAVATSVMGVLVLVDLDPEGLADRPESHRDQQHPDQALAQR